MHPARPERFGPRGVQRAAPLRDVAGRDSTGTPGDRDRESVPAIDVHEEQPRVIPYQPRRPLRTQDRWPVGHEVVVVEDPIEPRLVAAVMPSVRTDALVH